MELIEYDCCVPCFKYSVFLISNFFFRIGASPKIKQKVIWSVKDTEVSGWKRVAMTLPRDEDEYRLLLEGEYNKSTSTWTRNYVTVDNIELRSCLIKGK